MSTLALSTRMQPPLPLERDTTSTQVLSYGMVLMLVFFATRGFLPSFADSSASADTLKGQLYQVFVWMVALSVMHRYLRSISAMFWKMKAITLLTLLAPVSAIWSQLPADSFRRGIFLLLSTVFAFYLVRRFSPIQLAQIVVIAGVAIALLSIAISIGLPQVGVDATGNWQGPFGAKNACAQVVLFLLTAAATITFPTRSMNLLRYLFFALATVIIVMSRAKTSWLLGPAYLVLVGIGSWLRRVKRRDATIIVLAFLIVLCCFAALIPYVLPVVLDLLGKDAGMTGRVPLWQSAILSILKRPLLGYGYAAFWTGMQGESLNVFMGAHFLIYQAQNGILEIWLELGLVGVILSLATLLGAIRNGLFCFQYRHSSVVNWYVGLVALTVAYNFDEAFLAVSHHIGWLFYVIACAGLQQEADQIRSRSARLGVQIRNSHRSPTTNRSQPVTTPLRSRNMVPHVPCLSHPQ